MSLRTRIKGFTAWINLRLKPYNMLMNNVVMDLVTGTNMKMLMLSITGREFKNIQDFDGLTEQQKITRIAWAIEELKRAKLVPKDIHVDTRLFAMRSADHIFVLLWRLINNDIWFLWERAEYLQHDSDEILTEVPFKWIPEPPPEKKKQKLKQKKSLLSGFGSSSIITAKIEEDVEPEVVEHSGNYEPFPRNSFMKKFKVKTKPSGKLPSAEECILELVNTHLRMVSEGRKLHCTSIDDLADSRVLCAIINSFVPNTFTTEVLLNDRWAVNFILRTTEKMFYADAPFDSEDLAEADKMSVCSYFCAIFMLAYKYRQSLAVVTRKERCRKQTRENIVELSRLGESGGSLEEINRRQELKAQNETTANDVKRLEAKFDMDFCYEWVEHVQHVLEETHDDVRRKMVEKFDVLSVPRFISINDLCLAMFINLSLSNGTGFFMIEGKETVSESCKLILRNKETGEFIEEPTHKGNRDSLSPRRILRLPSRATVEINSEKYSRYNIFMEAASRNKQLRSGTQFLHHVFPSNHHTWHKVFIRAARDNDLELVKRMVLFFRNDLSFINCKEQHSGNSPLHVACRYGNYNIVLHLLENGANIDQKNSSKQTPLFSACEGLHRDCAMLLIEWGCDVHWKGPRNQTAFEIIKNDELRDALIATYEHYSTIVPQIMGGNTELLKQTLAAHREKTRLLSNLRSRLINGSTLLHTAAYFGAISIIEELLRLGLDVNLLDYKGATPLHRAKDVNTIKILLDNDATVCAEDSEGNTPLHVKCYGETGCESDMEAISLLMQQDTNLVARNARELLPIHCAAMQGRVDVIHALLTADEAGLIRKELEAEVNKTPPSLINLALANDYIPCAAWLVESGFVFKEGEQDLLLRRILTEQIQIPGQADVVRFLMDHGASAAPIYPGGNTPLHYAASILSSTELLETLLAFGADFNALNDDRCSPLFIACKTNNLFAANLLLVAGSNVKVENFQGLMAFDYITDYDEWIESGYFSEEIRARLKAYSLKHARDLVRAISKKVKMPGVFGATADQRSTLFSAAMDNRSVPSITR